VKLSNPIKKKVMSESLIKMKEAEKSDDAIESSEDESRAVSKNIKVSPPSVETKLKKAKAQKGKSPKSSSSNSFTSIFIFTLNFCHYSANLNFLDQEKYNLEHSPTKTNEKASKESSSPLSSALKTNGKSKIEKESKQSPVQKKEKIKKEKESPKSSEQTGISSV
jgi:hypothetical protein